MKKNNEESSGVVCKGQQQTIRYVNLKCICNELIQFCKNKEILTQHFNSVKNY